MLPGVLLLKFSPPGHWAHGSSGTPKSILCLEVQSVLIT